MGDASNQHFWWDMDNDVLGRAHPPHFHADYSGHRAVIRILDAAVDNGALPSKQLKIVLAWCVIHQEELMEDWELVKQG